MSKEVRSFSIDPVLWQKLVDLAASRDVSASHLLRYILTAWLKKQSLVPKI